MGALELRDKTVKDAMVPIESVYLLDIDTKLDHDTKTKLSQAAHSRIPVFEELRHNIIGVLLVKTLLCHDSNKYPTVRSLTKDRRVNRRVHFVGENMPLYDLLNEFQKGRSHLAVVTKNNPSASIENSGTSITSVGLVDRAGAADPGDVVGIITLEDVLEELLQEEIIDETDVYVDVRNRIKVARAKNFLGGSGNDDARSRSLTVNTLSNTTSRSTSMRRYMSISNDLETRGFQNSRPGASDNVADNVTDATPLLVDVS